MVSISSLSMVAAGLMSLVAGTHTGVTSFVADLVGVAACGISGNSYPLQANIGLPHGQEGCGKCVSVKNSQTGATVKATVVDKCIGCGENNLNLNSAAFKAIGDISKGSLNITWDFVQC